ncbi:type VI secretion system tip protein VgrG [Gilliamella sp. B14448G11]|uniref:type VI secretion system Vgr family protein n=3 Tax=unclassified Gilliamella TaxID=2685620 RepID=UPI0018DEC371|nr:type VI secretion system Vgr family protein [Gilliamella sp. B14448G11]MBI0035850.1 type VI secretion system tip protein VgrG [Gilliamella sp. B14448G11]
MKYIEDNMDKGLTNLVNQLGNGLSRGLKQGLVNGAGHNRYTLNIDGLPAEVSILQVEGNEQLNQPWHYTITFTCSDKQLSVESFLNQNARLSFNPANSSRLSDFATQGLNALNSLTSANPLDALKHSEPLKQLDKLKQSNPLDSLNSLTQFNPLNPLNSLLSQSGSRTLYGGVITQFSQLSVSNDEARYQVVLSSQLAKLALSHNCAIFQNQSVISVVEEVLRGHGYTGIDYRLALKEQYPEREFITQWQESDLEFIQRLLADVGVYFRFETHGEHNCDVLVISDYEQGYLQVADIVYKQPSGTLDNGVESVWDMTLHSQMVEASVTVQDYNYRDAQANLLGEVNSQRKDNTTYGTDYHYDEHYKGLNSNGSNTNNNDINNYNSNDDENSGDIDTDDSQGSNGNSNDNDNNSDNTNNSNSNNNSSDINSNQANTGNGVESGEWYARIRHEHAISRQIVIRGKSNQANLAPGQHIRIKGSAIAGIDEGIMILTVQGQGNRSEAYELSFTAIPYQPLKPYRPEPIPFPTIDGTLPARVTSPNNDTYGYIDTQGRYRVKFNFDLKEWRNGEESLWLRLAKPYAGSTYGFHFPLIDGTEVAVAFTNGNPDRPYIAHAMHDSQHPDHVTTINKHRNVIRTPANNKLRMDDKRGQEHIKLATEYGKTQLNIGHLVDQNKEQRGEGFELRTDEWGAIAANKGLYLTSQTEPKAQGKQLDMQGAITQLENALSIAKALQNAATASEAHGADTDSQEQLKATLTQLAQSGIIAYAQEGIALTSPENIQLSTSNSVSMTSENQTDINALKNITVSSGESIGLFAHKSGMKVFANQGDVNVQAQNANLNMAAKQDIKIDSVDGKLTVTASEELTLMCGGSYIKLSSAGIELGTADNVYIKSNALQKMGPKTIQVDSLALPDLIGDYAIKFICKDETGKIYANETYIATLPDGRKVQGQTDKKGYTKAFYTQDENETITLEFI